MSSGNVSTAGYSGLPPTGGWYDWDTALVILTIENNSNYWTKWAKERYVTNGGGGRDKTQTKILIASVFLLRRLDPTRENLSKSTRKSWDEQPKWTSKKTRNGAVSCSLTQEGRQRLVTIQEEIRRDRMKDGELGKESV